MRPTLNLNFRKGAQNFQVALHSPMQGFDSLRIVSQIISLQCLHYLILSMVIPPLLAALAFNPSALQYQGGATSLSMILDWREIAGVPVLDGGRGWPWNMYNRTLSEPQKDYLERTGLRTSERDDMGGLNRWWEWDMYLRSDSLRWTKEHEEGVSWSGKRPGLGQGQNKGQGEGQTASHVGSSKEGKGENAMSGPYWWNAFARDRSRGWIIVLSWALTGMADVFLLSVLIRRPTHILDHTLTLHFLHLLLTTFYTRNIPTSLFYWLVMLAHAGACVVWAEALSIRRELRTGWISGWSEEEGQEDVGDNDRQEEGSHLLGQAPSMGHANGNRGVTTHVLFEGDQDDDEDDHGHAKSGEKEANGHGHRHESIEMKRMK